MLFILTGDIQTGKTRWLIRLIEELETHGASCHGVVSPGIWRKTQTEDGSTCFEKLGIEAVLLPQGERFTFARRRDLVLAECDCVPNWQSMKAGLGWAIPDTVLDAVNNHFDRLAPEAALAIEQQERAGAQARSNNSGLLVVDELGRLELIDNRGLTSALRRLKAGPSSLYGTALAVVRSHLLDQAQEPRAVNTLWQMAEAWGGLELIAPNACGAQRVICAVAGDERL